MKIKHDYITNSSTTCFCAWGIELEYSIHSFPEIVKKGMYDEYLKYVDEHQVLEDEDGNFSYEKFLEYEDDWTEYFYKFIENKTNLSIESYYNIGMILIGMKVEHAPKNKTIQEICEYVQKLLCGLGFTEEVKYIEETWNS